MASVHRDSKSPYWFASFKDADGKWCFRSTKLTDKRLPHLLSNTGSVNCVFAVSPTEVQVDEETMRAVSS